MDQLIPVMNRLQEVLSTCNVPGLLSLPQIVVVGSQSSGKSSVLESIVGRDFLPRGTGIVTRSPLILQCIRSAEDEDYAEFGHLRGVRYTDFNEVRKEIEAWTNELAGLNKGISSTPISLKVYSSRVVDITLVDLPGIVVNPVGDQPADIESQVREMILKYITPSNSLILAISPGNVDIANSEAIRLARRVDPNGDRTLGVLTKLDCLGKGEDAVEILEGRTLPLRLGYVGIVCRSQDDIVRKVSISTHLAKEAKFFRDQPSYQHIVDRLGTPYLSHRLNKLLISHICERIPDLRRNISELLHQKSEELLSYGESLSDNKEVQRKALIGFFQDFSRAFSDLLEGRTVHKITEELRGGARIRYVFNEVFRKTLSEIDPFRGVTDQDIRTAMMNAGGPRGNLFIPEHAFELLARTQIKMFEGPSLECTQVVYDELKAIVNGIELRELHRFENLRAEIVEVVRQAIGAALTPTQEMVRNLVEIELNFINTQHPDLISGSSALQTAQNEFDSALVLQGRQGAPLPVAAIQALPRIPDSPGFFGRIFGAPGQAVEQIFGDVGSSRAGRNVPGIPQVIRASEDPSNRELIETVVIKKLLESYFSIVRKNLGDSVPKTIMTFLVIKSKDSLLRTLIASLYDEEKLDYLLHESGELHRQRQQCKEAIEQLRQASQVLSEVRELSAN
jgi:dynamin 1-like protein